MRAKACLVSLLLVVVATAFGAVRGDKAMYVGGTIGAIAEKQQGRLDVSGDSLLVFSWDKGKWETPFKQITKMEYGQRAGRRVGAAVAVTPFLLFSTDVHH